MKKKILCIANHAEFLGGGEHSFVGLLTMLAAPFEPVAVTPAAGPVASRLTEAGIQAHLAPLPPIRPWYLCSISRTIYRFIRLCRVIRPALVYANGSRAAFYGGIAARLLRIPVIWHCRIADSDPLLDPVLSRLCNRIIVNSRATAARFGPAVQPRIEIVYNGIDLDWWQWTDIARPALIQDDWQVVMVVSRVSEGKGHDTILAAFEQLAGSMPKLHLVCAGDRDPADPSVWENLQERTRASQFNSRIHWLGQVDDIRPWYRSATVSVLGSRNEAFGRVLIEAMACGAPVIATRSGGIVEIIDHEETGLLFDYGNAQALAEAMRKILTDTPLRDRLKRAGLARAADFSLASHVARMAAVFDACSGPGD